MYQSIKILLLLLLVFLPGVSAIGQTSNDSIMLAASKCDLPRIKELVKNGVSVNSTAQNGDTVLSYAVESNCVELVDFLLKSGADVNRKARHGGTPLMTAALKNRPHLAKKLLLAGADINSRDNAGWTAVTRAVIFAQTEMIWLLVDSGADLFVVDRDGYTLLMRAGNNIAFLELLLAKGLNVNAKNKGGFAAIHYAEPDAIRLLADKGAKVDERDEQGRTPLIWAVIAGQRDRVKSLINVGADVNAVDADRKSVLEHALNPEESDEGISKLIREEIISIIREAGAKEPR